MRPEALAPNDPHGSGRASHGVSGDVVLPPTVWSLWPQRPRSRARKTWKLATRTPAAEAIRNPWPVNPDQAGSVTPSRALTNQTTTSTRTKASTPDRSAAPVSTACSSLRRPVGALARCSTELSSTDPSVVPRDNGVEHYGLRRTVRRFRQPVVADVSTRPGATLGLIARAAGVAASGAVRCDAASPRGGRPRPRSGRRA